MVKNEKRVAAAKKAAKKNPWIQHVKALAKEKKLKLDKIRQPESKTKSKERLQGAAPIKLKRNIATIYGDVNHASKIKIPLPRSLKLEK